MKVLYVVPYVPNLIRSRPYNLIRALAQAGHEVTVYTLWSDEKDRQDLLTLEREVHAVKALELTRFRSLANSVLALPTRRPLQSVYCWMPEMASALEEAAGQNYGKSFDVVHVEHLRGVRYGVYLKNRFPKLPVVWDSVDNISYLFQQAAGKSRSLFGKLITRLELPRTKKYEAQLPKKFDHVVITSAIDRKALLDLAGDPALAERISVVPNGVDWDYFSQDLGITRDPASIVFSGKMSYHANITMALYLIDEIMPLVWAERPDLQLYIVGKDPPPAIKQKGSNPRIIVTGTVDDIRPYIHRASAAVVPLLYGAGSQFKVLEAMACGTPVVASPGAIMPLSVVTGRDILVGETAEQFSRHILDLVENSELRSSVGSAGREYVNNNHRWSVIGEQLARVYTQVSGQLKDY